MPIKDMNINIYVNNVLKTYKNWSMKDTVHKYNWVFSYNCKLRV